MVAHAIAYAKQTTHRRSIMAHDQPNDMPCHDRQPGVETVMRLAALPLLCGSSHISIISMSKSRADRVSQRVSLSSQVHVVGVRTSHIIHGVGTCSVMHYCAPGVLYAVSFLP